MTKKDPEQIVNQFNECISKKDLIGLTNLMTDDHVFIDRDGTVTKSKKTMTQLWEKFFEMAPDYKNTFTHIHVSTDFAVIIGYAYWSKDQPIDYVIWTAKIKNNLIQEWRIYDDNQQNRQILNLT
jgi:ketosteroid isomerase-like protein